MNEPISSIKIGMAIAGLLGAIISLKYLRPTATRMERFISFIGASAGTYYATPAIVTYLALTDGFENVVAFSVGIFFMQLVDVGMHIIDSYKENPGKILDIIKIKK